MKSGNEWKTARARASPVFTTKRIKDIFAHFQKASRPFFSNIDDMIEQGNQDKIDIKDLLKGSLVPLEFRSLDYKFKLKLKMLFF